jgi:hypothetical protein
MGAMASPVHLVHLAHLEQLAHLAQQGMWVLLVQPAYKASQVLLGQAPQVHPVLLEPLGSLGFKESLGSLELPVQLVLALPESQEQLDLLDQPESRE